MEGADAIGLAVVATTAAIVVVFTAGLVHGRHRRASSSRSSA